MLAGVSMDATAQLGIYLYGFYSAYSLSSCLSGSLIVLNSLEERVSTSDTDFVHGFHGALCTLRDGRGLFFYGLYGAKPRLFYGFHGVPQAKTRRSME